jgi:hypothetical protein
MFRERPHAQLKGAMGNAMCAPEAVVASGSYHDSYTAADDLVFCLCLRQRGHHDSAIF